LVAAEFPDDAEKRNAVLFSAASGKDLQFFPQYYQPYETALAQILKRSDSIASLQTKKPAAAQRLKMEIDKTGLQEDRLRILPVHSRFGFWTALIDAEDGKPIQYLPLDIDTL
jgi:hypothetical protein